MPAFPQGVLSGTPRTRLFSSFHLSSSASTPRGTHTMALQKQQTPPHRNRQDGARCCLERSRGGRVRETPHEERSDGSRDDRLNLGRDEDAIGHSGRDDGDDSSGGSNQFAVVAQFNPSPQSFVFTGADRRVVAVATPVPPSCRDALRSTLLLSLRAEAFGVTYIVGLCQ